MTQTRHTIRNIDPELMIEARVFSVQNSQTLGETLTDALEYYLSGIADNEDTTEDGLAIRPLGQHG